MADDDLNQQEWDNPDNWRNRRFLGIYSSPKDSRLIVPKPIPSQGWTINFGHPWGWALFLAFTGGILLLLLIIFGIVGFVGTR